MAKQINTNLKFTATPNTSGDNNNTSTTETDGCSTTFTSPQYNFTISCKHYLPCGKCDKTGETCTYYVPYYPTYPYYPHYPGWWEYGPIWTSSDYTITDRTESSADGTVYTMNMTGIKEAK